MMERLDVMRLAPATILDAGCGTGDALPNRRTISAGAPCHIDVALPCSSQRASASVEPLVDRLLPLGVRARRCSSAATWVAPFAPGTFDSVEQSHAAMGRDLPRAIAEIHRVLEIGGLVTFTTFGPDTLKELRAAFAAVDAHPHVGRFVDMHDVGDLLVQSGFADPVMQMEMLTLTYADARSMASDLKAIGATNAAQGAGAASQARALPSAPSHLEAVPDRSADGRIAATFEVIYGHAWKAAPRRTAEGHAIVKFER
jgi:malonyl-CoA O-methyltransferase